MPFLNFLKYNNIVPISLSLILVSAGGAYAATNPDAIFSSQQKVVSVDNTYIANKNLDTYSPTVTVTNVTEDATSYTVFYTISTIDIDNYVWKDVQKTETMVVDKASLNGSDLGLYVTGQFKNIIGNQIAYLRAVQEKERKNVTQQVVATTYGGLIGKFLDSKTEELPGYTPVVTLQQETPGANTAAVAASVSDQPAAPSDTTPPPQAAPVGATSATLSLQVLGNNPSRIAKGSAYADLGALLVDATAPNLGYKTYVDGVEQQDPNLDTSKPGVYTIEYRATDLQGIEVMARRIVLVGDVVDPGGEITMSGTAPVPAPAPAPVPASAPAPAATTTVQ